MTPSTFTRLPRLLTSTAGKAEKKYSTVALLAALVQD